MTGTYIKIYRDILEWRWFQDRNTLQLWLYILASVNIRDNDFMTTTIKRGELAASYPRLAAATGLTENQVRTALDHLKSTGEITVRRFPKFSVISVNNYDLYQGAAPTNHRQNTGSSQANHSNQRSRELKNTYGVCELVSTSSPHAHAHGKFSNVFLTDEEYAQYKDVPDIDSIIDELSEAIDTNPVKYKSGHTTSWLNKFIRAKRNVKKEPERRKMLK